MASIAERREGMGVVPDIRLPLIYVKAVAGYHLHHDASL